MSAQKTTTLKSEDLIPDTIDKCYADGIIKTGSGVLLGAALSLIVFRRRTWPIFVGFGTGIGMAVANCQHSLSKITAQESKK